VSTTGDKTAQKLAGHQHAVTVQQGSKAGGHHQASTLSSRNHALGLVGRDPQVNKAGGDAGIHSHSQPVFQVPLRKVAAFLRQAKLIPRLLDKYIMQQQRAGEDQKTRHHNPPGTLVLPSLQADAPLSRAWGFQLPSTAAERRRRWEAAAASHHNTSLHRAVQTAIPSRAVSRHFAVFLWL